MVPDLGSSRAENATANIGFCPGNVQERLTRGTERTTGWMAGYEVIKISRLLNAENLVGYGGYFKIYWFTHWELLEIGHELRYGY